jgi:hypothetical protein
MPQPQLNPTGYLPQPTSVSSANSNTLNNSSTMINSNQFVDQQKIMNLVTEKRMIKAEDLVACDRPSAYGSFSGAITPSENSNRILKEVSGFENQQVYNSAGKQGSFLVHSPVSRYEAAGQKFPTTDPGVKGKYGAPLIDVTKLSFDQSQNQCPSRANSFLPGSFVSTPSKKSSTNTGIYLKNDGPIILPVELLTTNENLLLAGDSFEKKINMLIEENYKLNMILNEKSRNSLNCSCSLGLGGGKCSLPIGATTNENGDVSNFKG